VTSPTSSHRSVGIVRLLTKCCGVCFIFVSCNTRLQFTVSGATATHHSSKSLALQPHSTVHSLWRYSHTPQFTVSGATATHHSSQSLALQPHTTVHSLALQPHTTVHSLWCYSHTPQFTVSGATATHYSSQSLALQPHTTVHSLWRYSHTPQFTVHYSTRLVFTFRLPSSRARNLCFNSFRTQMDRGAASRWIFNSINSSYCIFSRLKSEWKLCYYRLSLG
jgi:hypothetical protein